MYRINRLRNRVNNVRLPEAEPFKPILAAKRRRRRHRSPFPFSMGPVALSVCSVLLIGLMAILYLSQLGQAVTANQRLQDLHTQQSVLQRENQDLVDTIAQEQSPDYIAQHAKAQGLVPSDAKNIQILVIKHMEAVQKEEQGNEP